MKRILLINTLLLLTVLQAFAQNQVEGTITNIDGEPLPGVSVVIKGTTTGTITNLDGQYTLTDISPDVTITFSFIGMLQDEVVVGDQTRIDVVLMEDIQNLDEIVVVGYGSVKRANLTGAVTDIKAEKLENIPVADAALTLQGRMAGVKVGQRTGKPGSSAGLQIRTSTSYGAPEVPLYVIDGIALDMAVGAEQFNMIDPSEIESISILKDASAAVYGARSTGGVVLVTTKKGKEGKTNINYSASYGISTATQIPEMLSGYEHASMMNYIYDNDEKYDPRPTQYSYYTEDELEAIKDLDYNWLDAVWKDAITERHSLNVRGGTDKVKYFVGGNYYNETGNLDNLYVNKYTMRANIDANVTKNLTASFRISTNNKESKEPYFSGYNKSGVLRDTYKSLLTAPRWIPPTIDGKVVQNGRNASPNPYGLMNSGAYDLKEGSGTSIAGGLEYNVAAIQGLTLSVDYSFSKSSSYGKRYTQKYTVYNFQGMGTNRHLVSDSVASEVELNNDEGYRESMSKGKSYQFNSAISYNRTFGYHAVSAKFVYEQAENSANNFAYSVLGAEIPGIDYQYAFNRNNAEFNSGAGESSRLSYIGRLNYRYKDKYILEGTINREGSPNFMPNKEFGWFPAISAGWILSEESFFKDHIYFINFLKFRGTAGRTGNNNVPSNQYKYLFNANQTGAIFGNSITNSIEPRRDGLITPSITWQKSNDYNAAFDMRMLESKLEFSFDYWYRLTYDIFSERRSSLPSELGYLQPPYQNYGKMWGKGIELRLKYNGKITNDIKYFAEGVFSWDKHRKLVVDQNPAAIGRWDDQTLNDPGNQPGLICLGMIRDSTTLMQVQEMYTEIDGEPVELGMLYYADIRGENYSDGPDGKIDQYDRTTIAEYTNPPYNYGFTLGFEYKGIKIEATLIGEFGHKAFVNKDEMELPSAEGNVFAWWGDYWTPDNPDASMPRPYRYGKEGQVSTFWMRDGNTLRINNVNLSYTLPKTLVQKVNIANASVYFNARNIWTIISPFDYKDPSVSQGYDYPMLRSYNFGVRITI